MPAPRASRLASRKSVVADRDLYKIPDDDSDSDTAAPPTSTTIGTSSSSTATLRGKGIVNVADVETGNGTSSSSRRSTRQSPNRQNQAASTTSSNRNKNVPTTSPTRSSTTASAPNRANKVVPRSRARDDDQDEHNNNNGDMTTASATARAGTRTSPRSKKQKVDGHATDSVSISGLTSSATSGATSTARAGFVPRAATQQVQAAKSRSAFSNQLDGSTEDARPFTFSTNPPTPKASSSSSSLKTATGGRGAASKAKHVPRAAAMDIDQPVASTSQLSPPFNSLRSSQTAPIHVAETPVQKKNRAFRGQGDGTPGTPGFSARRSSVKGSGRRGSSIGGGFEVPPHVGVPDDKLYRQTNADDPVARRLRSIISWTAQRQRDRVLDSNSSASVSRAHASAVIESFIGGICDSSIDVSVPFQAMSSEASNDGLPQHPQNESNTARLIECKANHDAIGREQDLRQQLEPPYIDLRNRRTQARALSIPTVDPESLTFDLRKSIPSSIEEAVEMGESNLVDQTSEKGKGKATTADEVDESVKTLEEVRMQMAQFRLLAHRLSQFSSVSSTFVDERIRQAHQAVSAESSRGLSTHANANDSSVSGVSQVGLVVGSSSMAGVHGAQQPDAMDLLRAIAKEDTRKSGR